MKNLAFALINLFSTTFAFAGESVSFLKCTGLKNNHSIVIEKNQFGIEAAFYKRLTYSGMVLQTTALRKSWTTPNTFVSLNESEKLKFELKQIPAHPQKQASLIEVKKVKITQDGKSVDEVEKCQLNPRVSWTEQEF